jgi:membrane-associated phospholipid phosphatase
MPVLVALSRMYRGEHHPTDVLGSLVFSGLWLSATYLLIKPDETARQPVAAWSAPARLSRVVTSPPADLGGPLHHRDFRADDHRRA